MPKELKRDPRVDEGEKPLECKRCGHLWFPRVDNPAQCPSCRSPYWNTLRRRPW